MAIKTTEWIWFNGKLIPWNDARVHVMTHALHYGSSVFEGERMYGGEIFKLTPHSERLKRSAELLDFEIPFSVAEIDEAKALVLKTNGQKDAYVRPVAWRGSGWTGTVSTLCPSEISFRTARRRLSPFVRMN